MLMIRPERLRREESASQVGVEHQVPVVPRDIGGALADVAAGVVDQDVEAAERRLRGIRHTPDAALVTNVEFQRHDAPAEQGDLFFKWFQRRDRAAGDDQVGAGPGERAGERLSKTAAGASDNGDAAREIERIRHGRRMTLSNSPLPA
jgi:hypothetical protein